MSQKLSNLFLFAGLLLLGLAVSIWIPIGGLVLAAGYKCSPLARESRLHG